MPSGEPGFPANIPGRGPIRVLFSCVGRRVELIQAFRAAAKRIGRRVVLHGTDQSWLAPAMHHLDHATLTPPISSAGYVDALLALVQRHRIHVVVPLIDSDLLQLAIARPRFTALGCTVLISSPTVVAVCRDKMLCYLHLRESGIDTPATWSVEEARRNRKLKYPVYLKPRAGSAARGHYIVPDRASLTMLARRVSDPIVQEHLVGEEFTLDAYAAFDGRPRCIVPRLRIEVRSGEVSKGRVVKDRAVMAVGRRVIESLGQCVGVVTIQCIRTADKRIRVIEINPRFGGGIPLAIHAGADFPAWILNELSGKAPRIRPTAFEDGLTLLRYDAAVLCAPPRRGSDRPTVRRLS